MADQGQQQHCQAIPPTVRLAHCKHQDAEQGNRQAKALPDRFKNCRIKTRQRPWYPERQGQTETDQCNQVK